jgi:DNA-binding NarL/FixJ family response regulator
VISVLLVDDQPLLRMGFRMILEAEGDLRVVGEAGDGDVAVLQAAALRPDVVLMDVRMPTMDGIRATEAILAGDAGARVLLLTTFDLDEYVYAGLRAGASGFLLKDVPPAALLGAIRAVAAGDAVIAPSATRRLLDTFAARLPVAADPTRGDEVLKLLTQREAEVFRAVAAGLSNREIAEQLFLSEGTVKTHVGRILAKLDLRDRVQAVVLAYEAGLVSPGEAPKGPGPAQL